jgi:hypothetical protein
MPAGLATILYWLGILGLFRLNRDETERTSPALWLPVVWLTIGASRSLSQWLGGATVMASPDPSTWTAVPSMLFFSRPSKRPP